VENKSKEWDQDTPATCSLKKTFSVNDKKVKYDGRNWMVKVRKVF
jgi:hypothetical protein